MLLIYDAAAPVDPLAELAPREPPDEVECGESNDYWIRVVRSTGACHLVSKQTGVVAARCSARDAASLFGLGLTRDQVGAVLDAAGVPRLGGG